MEKQWNGQIIINEKQNKNKKKNTQLKRAKAWLVHGTRLTKSKEYFTMVFVFFFCKFLHEAKHIVSSTYASKDMHTQIPQK